MEAKLSEQEYVVMKCAAKQTGEFTVSDMCDLVHKLEQKRWGEVSVKTFLDRLVKKKLVKKRYQRVKYLKFRPLYQACFDEQFFLSHTREMPPVPVMDEEEKQKILQRLDEEEEEKD